MKKSWLYIIIKKKINISKSGITVLDIIFQGKSGGINKETATQGKQGSEK